MEPSKHFNGDETNHRLTVFIADNQPLYRQAVRQVLEAQAEVVGESALRPDVWNTIEELLPDVALVDVGLPFLTGFNVARQIARHCPRVAVVMISASPDDDQLFQAIKSGAMAFLSKDVSGDDLAGTLRRVGQGEYPINDSLVGRPNTAEKILRLFHNLSLMGSDVSTLVTPLSPRETEVLKYIAEGNSNKRIAFSLGVTEQTIKNCASSTPMTALTRWCWPCGGAGSA